jgi:hypothetical protein
MFMFYRTVRNNSTTALAHALSDVANYDDYNACTLAFLRLAKPVIENLYYKHRFCGSFKFDYIGASQYVFKTFDVTERNDLLIDAINKALKYRGNGVFFLDFLNSGIVMYPFTFVCRDEEYKIEMVSKTDPLDNTCGIFVVSPT